MLKEMGIADLFTCHLGNLYADQEAIVQTVQNWEGSMWTMNFQMFKLYLEKAEEPEIRFPTSAWSEKKQEHSRKTSTSASLTTWKTWCISQQTRKFLKGWEYQTTLPAFWETCMQVKKQQLELDMEQQTGSK